MATLLDMLRQPQQDAPSPQAGGQTEQASNILRTKLTGQADTGDSGVPKQTNIAEQQVNQQAQAQQKQMQAQGQIQQQQQRQQAADQEQNYQIQAQQIAQQAEQKRQTAALQTQQIVQENLQGIKKLQSDKDVAAFEQAAAMSRLANQKYIQNLTNAAAKAGIDNDANFKQSYYEQVFQDDAQLFGDDIGFKKMMDMDNRSFIRETSNMDIATAQQLANLAIQQDNSRSFYSSIGGLVSGGLQAYSAYDKYSSQQEQGK